MRDENARETSLDSGKRKQADACRQPSDRLDDGFRPVLASATVVPHTLRVTYTHTMIPRAHYVLIRTRACEASGPRNSRVAPHGKVKVAKQGQRRQDEEHFVTAAAFQNGLGFTSSLEARRGRPRLVGEL